MFGRGARRSLQWPPPSSPTWAGRLATAASWREYGIPAVLGTGVATKRITSGQIITVDGGTGIVTLSKNGS